MRGRQAGSWIGRGREPQPHGPVEPEDQGTAPLPSSAIRALSYDAQTRTLFVTFVDGDLYAYRGVEPEAYAAFQAAPSKGRFFARRVRGRYGYVKMGVRVGRPADPQMKTIG